MPDEDVGEDVITVDLDVGDADASLSAAVGAGVGRGAIVEVMGVGSARPDVTAIAIVGILFEVPVAVGLFDGDEIVAINLNPVSKMNMEDVDNYFKSKNGRSLLLDIYHDKKYDKVIITLKRRI